MVLTTKSRDFAGDSDAFARAWWNNRYKCVSVSPSKKSSVVRLSVLTTSPRTAVSAIAREPKLMITKEPGTSALSRFSGKTRAAAERA
jgi:hypothetical protein